MVNVVDPTSGEELTKSVRPRNSLRTIASRNLLPKKSKQPILVSKNKVKRADDKPSDTDLTTSKGIDVITDVQLKKKLSQSGFPNIPITSTTKDTLVRNLKKAPRLNANLQNSVKTYGTNDKTKADEVALLTDPQLRSALLKYGFQNIPITDTTRHQLKNKLILIMNSIHINHLSVFISNTYCDCTDKGTLNKVKPAPRDPSEANRGSTRCQRPVTQSDNSTSKKSMRKRLELATHNPDPCYQGPRSRSSEDNECDAIIITMQHQTLHRQARVGRGSWDIELKSFYDTASNGISDYDEPVEEIIHSFLGNAYRLGGFRSYW